LNQAVRRIPQPPANRILVPDVIANQHPELPSDIGALQALLVAARSERDAAIAERDQALSANRSPQLASARLRAGRV
jgi:hypothetical protein